MNFTVVLVTLIYISFCSAYKILVVTPIPARSHFILMSTLAKGLAEAGHDVTIITSIKDEELPNKGTYKQVYVGSTETNDLPINFFDMGKSSPLESFLMTSFFGTIYTNITLNHPSFLELIKSKETFDAVIVEQFVDDALKVLAHHYKAPLILFSTIGANDWINNYVGNPSAPSYIPDIFLSYGHNMTFYERLINVLLRFFSESYRQLLFFPEHERLMKKVFPTAPGLNVLNYNVSLVLLNSHESINQPVPKVPCMIQIGGYHVRPPKKLPNDLQKFLDQAKEGVIYFSLGSNVKPSQMNNSTKKIITRALGKLKQQVLWKWDEDQLPEQPPNVKISKWFPQQDILAHPNVKLFITHGGLLSITETIFHGVPVLILPVFGDQMLNARRAENNGFALTIPFDEITEERFSDALNKLLNDSKYWNTVKFRSSIMHDRETKPMNTAVYWVEYVIRHKGAPHLRVGGVDLPWYKYHLLDVLAFILVVALFISYIIRIVIIKVIECVIGRKYNKVKLN